MTEAVATAADRADLGRYLRTYLPEPSTLRWSAAAIALIVSGVVVTVAGFAAGMPLIGVLGIVMISVGGGWLLWDLAGAGSTRGSRLDLYEHGVVASGKGQVRVVRYDTTTLRRKIVHAAKDVAAEGISYRYTIVDTDGAPVVLRHGIECPRRCGAEIEQGILDAQLPAARAELAAGGRLDFAPLWLTAQELGTGSESVPWSQVGDLEVVGGWLSVRVRGRAQPLESLPLCLVPNYVVFRALAERLHTPTASGSAG